MKTDTLINMLATGVVPVPAGTGNRRFRIGLFGGALGALLLMGLVYGVRQDVAETAWLPMFWVKLALPLSLAIPALVLTQRLSQPGVRTGSIWIALLLPWLLVTALAALVLLKAAPNERLSLLLGNTWSTCVFNIALVSVPVLTGTLWAMKGMAPTRPALAGASCGLLSAMVGTAVYALHCPEMEAPFLALWYGLGMLIPTAVGAAIGSKYLRW